MASVSSTTTGSAHPTPPTHLDQVIGSDERQKLMKLITDNKVEEVKTLLMAKQISVNLYIPNPLLLTKNGQWGRDTTILEYAQCLNQADNFQRRGMVDMMEQQAYQQHKAEDFKTLKEVYDGFYSPSSDVSSIDLGPWHITRQTYINNHPNIFSRLTITIPPKEMKEIFHQYGIIALRRLELANLTACCGNSPIYSSTMKIEYLSNCHEHAGQDTCDIDLLMNPSIVANMNSPKFIEYIASQKYQYLHVKGEHKNMFTFKPEERLEESYIFLQKILQLNGTYSHTYSTEITDDQWVNTIQQTAKKYGLEVEVLPQQTREEGHISDHFEEFANPVFYYELTVTKKTSIPKID